MDSETIYFYDCANDLCKEEHIFLNNFDVSPIKDDNGKAYNTVEHYYQAHKFDNFTLNEDYERVFEEIRTVETPLACKKLARKYEDEFQEKGVYEKEKWESGYKVEVMERGVWLKFTQNLDLQEKLLATGEAVLVEASPRDAFWGGLLEGSQNMLGKVLMTLRTKLRK